MDKTKLITIVIPCFNDGGYLLENLNTLEGMSSFFDIVIVNDGSTDIKTLEILKSLDSQGYNLINSDNQGPSNARNLGIGKSLTKYILPLDCDNLIQAEYLLKSIDLLEWDESIGVVYSDRFDFSKESKDRVKVGGFDLKRLRHGNFIDTCAVFRKKVWEDCGGYDTNLKGLEDWEFWINAAVNGWGFEYIPEPLFSYRIKPENESLRCLDEEEWKRQVNYIMEKHSGVFFYDKDALFDLD